MNRQIEQGTSRDKIEYLVSEKITQGKVCINHTLFKHIITPDVPMNSNSADKANSINEFNFAVDPVNLLGQLVQSNQEISQYVSQQANDATIKFKCTFVTKTIQETNIYTDSNGNNCNNKNNQIPQQKQQQQQQHSSGQPKCLPEISIVGLATLPMKGEWASDKKATTYSKFLALDHAIKVLSLSCADTGDEKVIDKSNSEEESSVEYEEAPVDAKKFQLQWPLFASAVVPRLSSVKLQRSLSQYVQSREVLKQFSQQNFAAIEQYRKVYNTETIREYMQILSWSVHQVYGYLGEADIFLQTNAIPVDKILQYLNDSKSEAYEFDVKVDSHIAPIHCCVALIPSFVRIVVVYQLLRSITFCC